MRRGLGPRRGVLLFPACVVAIVGACASTPVPSSTPETISSASPTPSGLAPASNAPAPSASSGVIPSPSPAGLLGGPTRVFTSDHLGFSVSIRRTGSSPRRRSTGRAPTSPATRGRSTRPRARTSCSRVPRSRSGAPVPRPGSRPTRHRSKEAAAAAGRPRASRSMDSQRRLSWEAARTAHPRVAPRQAATSTSSSSRAIGLDFRLDGKVDASTARVVFSTVELQPDDARGLHPSRSDPGVISLFAARASRAWTSRSSLS